MGDWLQIHDWLHDNMATLLDSALHGSPLDAYSGGLATVIATGLTCVSVLGIFMLGLGAILWVEPKVWAE